MLPPLPGGVALKLAKADGVVGGTIWPAATAMCRHVVLERLLQNQEQSKQKSQRTRNCIQLVELGSGTGAVGIFAAAALRDVQVTLTEHKPPLEAVMTSVPYSVDGILEHEENWESEFNIGHKKRKTSDRLLQLLQNNVDRNASLFRSDHQKPAVEELFWGNGQHIQRLLSLTKNVRGYDIVLASDVTYQSNLLDPLTETIAGLLSKSEKSRPRGSGEDENKNEKKVEPTAESSSVTDGPTCFVAHQERLVDWNGMDMQLSEFHRALENVGLETVAVSNHPVITADSKRHNVQILEIRHSQ